MKIDELRALLEKQTTEVKDLSAVNDLLDEVMEGEVETEVEEEEAEEEAEEEEAEEEAHESEEEPESEEEDEEEETPTVELSAVLEEILSLRTQVAELVDRNNILEAQLAAKTKAETDFITKFKNLSAVIREDEKPVVKEHKIGMTNGIGEL